MTPWLIEKLENISSNKFALITEINCDIISDIIYGAFGLSMGFPTDSETCKHLAKKHAYIVFKCEKVFEN